MCVDSKKQLANDLIVKYMNNNKFDKSWSRVCCNEEFACYGIGNHIDATFSVSRIEKNGEVFGVIHPGNGAFYIGKL